MSGPLAQFRTPSRPLFTEVEVDNPLFGDPLDEDGTEPEKIKVQVPVMHPAKTRLVCQPHSLDDDGNPTEYYSEFLPAQRHGLDVRLTQSAPGKHRKGRAPKMTRAERRQRKLAERARRAEYLDAKAVSGD